MTRFISFLLIIIITSILHKGFQGPGSDHYHVAAIFRDSAEFQKLLTQQISVPTDFSLVLEQLKYRIPERTVGLGFLHDSVQCFFEGNFISNVLCFILGFLENQGK